MNERFGTGNGSPLASNDANVRGLSSSALSTPNVVLPSVPVSLLPQIGSTMLARVDGGAHVAVAAAVPAMLKRPMPSMKNGRFSEKKIGKRWFTSTWNASLSTWLKSGLTVPSSVMPEVMPNLPLAPKLYLSSALFQRARPRRALADVVGHARQHLHEAARLSGC